MAQFSQSLFLGENTLESIEKQAVQKHGPLSTPPQTSSGASRRSTRSSQTKVQKRHSSDEQQLEVIEESPTNNATRGFGGSVTGQRSVRERLKTIGTQSRSRTRKGLRRNKSDSVVSAVEQQQRSSKARSESRDQIDMIDSELLRSDVRFDGLSGRPQEGIEQNEINISKLLESDLSFEVPVRSFGMMGSFAGSIKVLYFFRDYLVIKTKTRKVVRPSRK